MYKNNIWKKGLAVVVIALFLGISTISTARNIETKNIPCEEDIIKDTFKETNSQSIQAPVPYKFGTKGENNWYITCVTISFGYDPGLVKEIWIKIGGNWEKYTGPFDICQDGIHNIPWKWIDHNDEEHIDTTPINFKIDQKPPTISLKKKADSETQITFTANANDATSGILRVNFYVDDEYMSNDTTKPYTYVWEGTTQQTIKAVAYDYAGHFASAEGNTKPRSYMFKAIFLSQPLRNLLNIIILSQKIFLGSIL